MNERSFVMLSVIDRNRFCWSESLSVNFCSASFFLIDRMRVFFSVMLDVVKYEMKACRSERWIVGIVCFFFVEVL